MCEGEHECGCCCGDPDMQVYLEEGAQLYAPREGDAGFDLYAFEEVSIAPHEQVLVSTGMKVAIPDGWVGIVKDRSSMALKRLYTHAGVIDAGYRGEVKVALSNEGSETFVIEKGMKFAQMIVIPCLTGCIKVAKESDLGATERGAGGFGSTGNA